MSTGGSVGAQQPGAGQSQADIDAEARRIEAEILGHEIPSAPAPRQTADPAPQAERPAARQKANPAPQAERPAPRKKAEPNPAADIAKDIATAAATAFGRQVVRSIFGTKRRGRRTGGLFG